MRLLKVEQVLMVSDHSYRMACPLEIVFPFSESVDHSKEFTVKNVVVMLCSGKSFGEEGTRVQVFIKICLHKDCPSGCEGGIGHDHEGFSGVWESQDRSLNKGCLQSFKCGVAFCCPVPFCLPFG